MRTSGSSPGSGALFGGHLREALTAGAPIALEVLEFFYAAGVPVMEGYGMTETMAIGTINLTDAFRFGTVGRAAPGVEVRIAEDGEILMRGPHVFTGYWENEAATREVLDEDGWLRTGDLGSLDEDGFLSITGRIKDIIITAGGKNITPQNLENDLKQSPIISQAVMYGDRRPYPVALVTLDPEVIIPWAHERGLPEDVGALAQHPEVNRLVQEALDRANARYAQVEQIKRFAILDHDLTQETGELTPTMKVKRNIVYERYADVFDELYALTRGSAGSGPGQADLSSPPPTKPTVPADRETAGAVAPASCASGSCCLLRYPSCCESLVLPDDGLRFSPDDGVARSERSVAMAISSSAAAASRGVDHATGPRALRGMVRRGTAFTLGG